MNESQQWGQVELVRSLTLLLFDLPEITEESADIKPAGFNNNIRWNFGHILITQEQLLVNFAGMAPWLPPTYIPMFGNKTKPDDWTSQPPTLTELREKLAEQPDVIRNELSGKLELPLKKPFLRNGRTIATFGELVAFSLYHEGLHTGVISSMRKLL